MIKNPCAQTDLIDNFSANRLTSGSVIVAISSHKNCIPKYNFHVRELNLYLNVTKISNLKVPFTESIKSIAFVKFVSNKITK